MIVELAGPYGSKIDEVIPEASECSASRNYDEGFDLIGYFVHRELKGLKS